MAFGCVRATVGAVTEGSKQLRRSIESGNKIIISTVQKFPFILDEIGDAQRGRRFATIIDEAHSSQGGRTSAAMSEALAEAGAEGEDETLEDQINRLMESRKLLPNASYFAFTATPENKTLEIFGGPDPEPDGTIKHRAFHSYTMKQAIQEGFILEVLANAASRHRNREPYFGAAPLGLLCAEAGCLQGVYRPRTIRPMFDGLGGEPPAGTVRRGPLSEAVHSCTAIMYTLSSDPTPTSSSVLEWPRHF